MLSSALTYLGAFLALVLIGAIFAIVIGGTRKPDRPSPPASEGFRTLRPPLSQAIPVRGTVETCPSGNVVVLSIPPDATFIADTLDLPRSRDHRADHVRLWGDTFAGPSDDASPSGSSGGSSGGGGD